MSLTTERQQPSREGSIHDMKTMDRSSLASFEQGSRNSYGTHSPYDEDTLADLCVLTDAKEAKLPETTIEPPALPQKSSLRASRMLETLKKSKIESATQSLTTSHEMYLSSEEDASSSADDFSDYDYESESEESLGSPVTRKSFEDTARLISVVFSGKPSIIDLPSPRRISSSASSDEDAASTQSSSASQSSHSFPSRQSSFTTSPPAFLNIDPFAQSSSSLEEKADDQEPRTPTAVFSRVQKTLNLVRKRSRPAMNTLHKSDSSREAIGPLTSSSTLTLPTMEAAESDESNAATQTTKTANQSPVRYHDIMRFAKKNASAVAANAQPIPPPSPQKKGLLSGLNMARRRSMKA